MSRATQTVVIVGGGTAGWLTAGLLAAEHRGPAGPGLRIVLIESPDVGPIGVGEGTWPTMRLSLENMGISETAFVRECDVSFKQGTRFDAWLDGGAHSYYHPFTPPQNFNELSLARYWQPLRDKVPFAAAVSPQSRACDRGLAPKQITTPEFASNLNYGYHLDAGKFAKFLEAHCVAQLGVEHVLDNVVAVNASPDGDIESLLTASGTLLQGDLFVDCTGFAALLIGEHFGIPFRSVQKFLFNDTALAVQVPRSSADEPVMSTTLSTAQRAGWIWDIALPSRRGVGYAFSGAHTGAEEAEAELRAYLAQTAGEEQARSCTPRLIRFRPGHREKLWHRNCVAIGLSGGFVEPLEASALVLIELSAKTLAERLPPNRDLMEIAARQFNARFLYHWQRIVDFLKLHYALSGRRDTDYWCDNCDTGSIPENLRDSLELWRYDAPWHQDLPQVDELFSAASYQYVLYGMLYATEGPSNARRSDTRNMTRAKDMFESNERRTAQLLRALPTNRELLGKVHEFGFQKV